MRDPANQAVKGNRRSRSAVGVGLDLPARLEVHHRHCGAQPGAS